MTPERFALAVVLFHVILLAASWHVAARWTEPERCRLPLSRWVALLAHDVLLLAAIAAAASLLAPVVANLDGLRRLHASGMASRLVGQALFGEGVLLAGALAVSHGRCPRRARATALSAAAIALFAVYVDAYHVEPNMLRVRRHVVEEGAGGEAIRILHLTDIQTPAIGEHEERALRTGMTYRPDMIVLTGDYVQDALGRPSERQAARDLGALIARIGFVAPLGVYATEGDVGPPCREVFAGTKVRCLVDETVTMALTHGGSLAITGLSRGRGRERDPKWLAALLAAGPPAAHRIVISHAPDFVDALPERVDLVLAGHTHGGQVVLPLFGPPVTASRLPRLYAGGLHDYRGVALHVSRGVGMERGFAVPVRFLCPPEICVLDVRFATRTAI